MKIPHTLGAICVSVWVAGAIPVHASDLAEPKRADFAPVLTVGAKWRVEVEGISEPPARRPEELVNWKPTKFVIVYRFLVEALETVDSEPCYRISIDAPTDDEKKSFTPLDHYYYWRIYLRQAGFTLKRVERVDGRTDRLIHTRGFEQSGPFDATISIGRLPLAVPTFQEGFDPDAFIRKDKNGKITAKPSYACTQTETFTQLGVNGKETGVLKLTLEKDKDRGGSSYCRMTQTWVKGEPWWTEATYEWGGGRKYSAKLLKDDKENQKVIPDPVTPEK